MVIEIIIINSKPTFTSNLPVEHIYLYVLYLSGTVIRGTPNTSKHG
jgi:hypothetical protein